MALALHICHFSSQIQLEFTPIGRDEKPPEAVESDWLIAVLIPRSLFSCAGISIAWMAWKNPLDMFWTSSVEPRLFLLYFLVQLGMGLPWTALSLMFYNELVWKMQKG